MPKLKPGRYWVRDGNIWRIETTDGDTIQTHNCIEIQEELRARGAVFYGPIQPPTLIASEGWVAAEIKHEIILPRLWPKKGSELAQEATERVESTQEAWKRLKRLTEEAEALLVKIAERCGEVRR